MSPLHRHQPPSVQTVTSAPESLEEEQSTRIRRYLITMGIRTACFILAVVLHGWLRWTFAAGAIVLPFFAVVMANSTRPRAGGMSRPAVPRPDITRHLGGPSPASAEERTGSPDAPGHVRR